MTVVGKNFPAEDVITITYDRTPVTVATTDTVGKWRATFKIPVDATIGKEYEVVAQSEVKGSGGPREDTGQQTVDLDAIGGSYGAGRDPDGLAYRRGSTGHH